MHRIDYVVKDNGVFLGKQSERMVVRKEGKVIKELPFLNLKSILVQGQGVSFSSALVEKCCEYGIQIDFLSYSGQPIGKVYSPTLSATIEIQKAQYTALENEKGIELVLHLMTLKLENQKRLLKYFNKYQKSEEVEQRTVIIDRSIVSLKELKSGTLEELRPTILGIEGVGGSHYWQGVKELIKEHADFPGRKHRGAKDTINSMLNYGYGILYSRVWGMIALAGMEPFLGFLHTDRSGKPSLVLDITEIFRVIIDHTVIAIVNDSKKELPATLDTRTKEKLVNKIMEKFQYTSLYRGSQFTLESIMQQNIRNISMFLRGLDTLELFIYPF